MKINPGIILVNKPRGRSSFSIVAQIRRLSGIKKVGHAGTLDPQAEGLMIILVSKEWTSQAAKYSKFDKTYEFKIKLGENSSTGDIEGEKNKISKNEPSEQAIFDVINQFKGRISQTPPIYSAVKINGQRSYKLARKGQKPKIKSRTVNIFEINLISYSYPYATIRVKVSSGTYIRSLAQDIGKALKTGAYCTEIKRIQIGKYHLKDAICLD